MVSDPHGAILRRLECVHNKGARRSCVTVDHELRLGTDHLGARTRVLPTRERQIQGGILRDPGSQHVPEVVSRRRLWPDGQLQGIPP